MHDRQIVVNVEVTDTVLPSTAALRRRKAWQWACDLVCAELSRRRVQETAVMPLPSVGAERAWYERRGPWRLRCVVAFSIGSAERAPGWVGRVDAVYSLAPRLGVGLSPAPPRRRLRR